MIEIDEATLAAVIARHMRTPQSWEQEKGVFVRCGADGLAKRLLMKLEEAKKRNGKT